MATVRNRKAICKFKLEPLMIEEEELSLAAPPAGAIIKVMSSGLCHSDIHLRTGTVAPDTMWPRVLGHEISGEVVSIGEEKIDSGDDVRVGDRVLVYPWGGCRKCAACRAGSQDCHTRQMPGSQMYGITQDGGFQEYVTIYDRRLLLKIPDNLSTEVACIIPCSGVTAYNGINYFRESVENGAKIYGDAAVLIVGAGGLGIWAISIAKAMFPSNVKICLADISSKKLMEAKNIGVDVTILLDPQAPPKESAEKVKAAVGTSIFGAVDYVGRPSTVETSLWSLVNSGTLAVVGLHGGDMPSVPLRWLVGKAIRIQGVFVGSIEQTKELLKLVTDGKVQPPSRIRISLPEVEATLQNLEAGKVDGRAVIKF